MEFSREKIEAKEKELADERSRVLELLLEEPKALQFQAEVFRDDENLVLSVAEKDIGVVRFASYRLRGSLEFGEKVIDLDPIGYQCLLPVVQDKLMTDPLRAANIIKVIPGAIRLLPPELRASKAMALQVLPFIPVGFELFSDDLRDDLDVAKAALQKATEYEKRIIFKVMSPRLRELLS